MDVYLVRHTTPQIEKGICYGQADIDVTSCFSEEAENVARQLPSGIRKVYCSPLMRCRKLAEHLYPKDDVEYMASLREIDCGEWELKRWIDIDPSAIDHWMRNYEDVPYPGGENYRQFRARVLDAWDTIKRQHFPALIITHGGVIKTILSHLHGLGIESIGRRFNTDFGCVVRCDVREG